MLGIAEVINTVVQCIVIMLERCLQELFQDRGVQASVGMLAAAIATLYIYCTVFVTTI